MTIEIPRMMVDGLEFLLPVHPTLHFWPAPLMAHWLEPDDERWSDGPWKSMAKVARDGGWVVKAFVARGYTPTAVGKVGPLTDTLSLRCWRAAAGGGGQGDVDHAVAMWSRTTWPVLGRRAATAGEAEERQGEGRKTNEGKTWLWHPPMLPPPVEVVPWHPPMKTPAKDVVKDPLLTKWTYAAGWMWQTGPSRRVPLTVASSAHIRNWLKKVPDG